jgi:glycosyltransferase involved in cell wall biosynthesis
VKITIVLGAFLPVPPIMGGAVEKVWFALAPEFARRGHEVVLISRALAQFPREENRETVRHLRVRGFDAPRSLVWLKFLDFVYTIRAMSILPKADIVVTNTFWLPILLRDQSRGHVYVHATRYPKGQMRFYGRAARLQAPSRAVAQAISKEAPKFASKVTVIPNPAPRSTIAGEPPPISEREKIMLYVGRVHPEKGVHLLVDAFANKARTVFADWKLMIVGPTQQKFGGGGEAYLASLKRAERNIVFAGPIFDAAELDRKYRTARLFVYPSLAETGESFGLAPLEAMAHRCAVLVSNLACFHDFIREGETGFVFDHRTASPATALSQKLENLDLAALARVADAGYRKAAEYSLERVTDQFLADFKSVVFDSYAERTSR